MYFIILLLAVNWKTFMDLDFQLQLCFNLSFLSDLKMYDVCQGITRFLLTLIPHFRKVNPLFVVPYSVLMGHCCVTSLVGSDIDYYKSYFTFIFPGLNLFLILSK